MSDAIGANRVGARRRAFGVVGGLGTFGGADVLSKLEKALLALGDEDQSDIRFEQHPFDGGSAVADDYFDAGGRKFDVFDTIKELEHRGADRILLASFISHTFVDEIQPEVNAKIVNIMSALRDYLVDEHKPLKKIGILTSTYVKSAKLFESYFGGNDYQLIYPREGVQNDQLMTAIYGPRGLKTGELSGRSIDLIFDAAQDLIDQGAEIVVPGMTEIPIIHDALSGRLTVPLVDSNSVYAINAARYCAQQPEDMSKASAPFKIGIVGGVGPAATVDLMAKIISHTKAATDQEHIKMVVEHNPQIPDRTDNLIGDGQDPTISLYAACKKLEMQSATAIAIPCNTAHAFLERIQRRLDIPIISMIYETVQYIRTKGYADGPVGLLATSGTVESRVYHEIAEANGLELITPDAEYQARCMEAIYGEKGVKAGYTEGECKDNLMAVVEYLVSKGARTVILGCTELPLLLEHDENFMINNEKIAVIDPTNVLARKIVELAN